MTEKITIAEYRALVGTKKKKKHPCRLHVHESATERADCLKFQLKLRLGEIESFKWQVRLKIAPGKYWAIDFGYVEKGKPTFYDEIYTGYMESKGWNQSNDLALYKLKMSQENYPKRVILWNWKLVPPLDSAGRHRLRDFAKQISQRKEWAKKINKIQRDKAKAWKPRGPIDLDKL